MFADERATLDEQREFARRELHRLLVLAPQLGEAPLLEPFVTRSRMQLIPLLRRALCA